MTDESGSSSPSSSPPSPPTPPDDSRPSAGSGSSHGAPTRQSSPTGGRAWFVRVGRVAVTLALLWYVLRGLDAGRLLATLGEFDPVWVAVALALQFAGIAASTFAWRSLLAPFVAERLPLVGLFRTYLVSRFVGLAGPGTVVGDASRVYFTRGDGDLAPPTAAVVTEKALYAAGFVGVAAAAGALISTPPEAGAVIAAAAGLFLVGVAGVLLALLAVGRYPTHRLVAPATAVVRGYRARPGVVLEAAVSTLGTVAAAVLSTWALVLALDLSVSLAYLWATVPLVAVAVALPVSVQGLGVREGAYVLLFGFVGVGTEAALAISVANFALGLVVAGVGGLLYAVGRREVTAA